MNAAQSLDPKSYPFAKQMKHDANEMKNRKQSTLNKEKIITYHFIGKSENAWNVAIKVQNKILAAD